MWCYLQWQEVVYARLTQLFGGRIGQRGELDLWDFLDFVCHLAPIPPVKAPSEGAFTGGERYYEGMRYF